MAIDITMSRGKPVPRSQRSTTSRGNLNRARQYKMFMERGEKELAAEQVEGHPELIEEEKPEAKSKKGK